MPSYVWRCPGRPLTERRSRAERRREELLHIFYQENIITDRVEDLVREWVALLVERDMLLREHLYQENRTRYFTDLQELLRDQPSLGDGSEEVLIKETLMGLRRCVSHYCMRRDIEIFPNIPLLSDILSKPLCHQTPPPPPAPTPTITKKFIQPELKFYEHNGKLLDLETGQTGIDVVGSSEKDHSGSSSSLFKEAKMEVPALPYRPNIPIADQLGKEHLHGDNSPKNTVNNDTKKMLTSNHGKTTPLPIDSSAHIPPVRFASPPPLPLSPPLNLTLLPPSSVMGKYSQRGGAGTVQFAGMAFTNSAWEQAEPMERSRAASAGGSGWEKNTTTGDGKDHVDHTGRSTEQKDEVSLPRKNLMMEISSVGQTALKRTNCPRSPSGTPIKKSFVGNIGDKIIMTLSSNHNQHHNNTDMLQIALLAKFRSLYSTPFGQKLSCHPNDGNNSFDFSSTWSDINSSVQIFDDPGITNTSTLLKGFGPSQK